MAATSGSRSSGTVRGYTNEQKTLRAKLDQMLKWTRDLKTTVMKQSCKVLQNSNRHDQEDSHRTIDQIHDQLDDYKRKFDRELGRIHDICDALIDNNQMKNGDHNLQDEILEALRRSPTYSSLEQHMYDDRGPRIRVKPREQVHPGRRQISRASTVSTDTIKRKATQPIALQVLDTSCTLGSSKRRPPNDAFKRSRSFINVEHQETQLGMDYIEEDESDISWKPFGPKRTVSQTTLSSNQQEQSNDEPSTSSPIPSTDKPSSEEKSKVLPSVDDNSSDEEFDVAWQRRAKQKARKEAAAAAAAATTSTSATVSGASLPTTPSAKRTVRFALSSDQQIETDDLNVDESTQDACPQPRDQNNNNHQQDEIIISVISIDEEESSFSTMDTSSNTQSQITTTSSQSRNIPDDDAQIIDDSDDDEIIALSDEESSSKSTIRIQRKPAWTTSEIQITRGNSQPQSMHNPYRVGIADPSLRSIFLPPPPLPNSQPTSGTSTGNKRNQNTSANRKTSPNKRTTSSK